MKNLVLLIPFFILNLYATEVTCFGYQQEIYPAPSDKLITKNVAKIRLNPGDIKYYQGEGIDHFISIRYTLDSKVYVVTSQRILGKIKKEENLTDEKLKQIIIDNTIEKHDILKLNDYSYIGKGGTFVYANPRQSLHVICSLDEKKIPFKQSYEYLIDNKTSVDWCEFNKLSNFKC